MKTLAVTRNSRTGSVVIMLLVVILLVGILTQQTVRSLWILRRSQDYQFKIQQANQLLELGRSLDRRPDLIDNTQQQLPLIVQVGSDYARLEAIDQKAENGNRSIWVAKLPVDAAGMELPNQVPIVVSCERSK
jgi:hypothetical protein